MTATKAANPSTSTHEAKSSASRALPRIQVRRVPTRSASLPSGTDPTNTASPPIVRPSPTWAAESPTIWVK